MKLQIIIAGLLALLAMPCSAANINSLPYPAKATYVEVQIPTLLLSEGLSEAEAAARARTSSEDKILKIERVTIDKRPMYKVKILTADGRVKIVYVDAEE